MTKSRTYFPPKLGGLFRARLWRAAVHLGGGRVPTVLWLGRRWQQDSVPSACVHSKNHHHWCLKTIQDDNTGVGFFSSFKYQRCNWLFFHCWTVTLSPSFSGIHVAAREAVQRAKLPQPGAQCGINGPSCQHGRGRLQSQNSVGQRHERSVSAVSSPGGVFRGLSLEQWNNW